MLIEMTVAGLTIDSFSNAPIVILRETTGDRLLPIRIGVIEASAIAFKLEKVTLSRPMAHDLLRDAVMQLGAVVARVLISDLRENTYIATVELSQAGRIISLDARPSDAIALALLAQAPIVCEEKVIELTITKRVEAEQQKAEREAAARGGIGPVSSDDDFDTGVQFATPVDEQLDEDSEGMAPVGDDVERGADGPQPILSSAKAPTDLLERLNPEAFGKYKM